MLEVLLNLVMIDINVLGALTKVTIVSNVNGTSIVIMNGTVCVSITI